MNTTENVMVTIRHYLSITHIQSKKLEASNDPSRTKLIHNEQRACVIGAIWSAVGCLEAAINEFFADAEAGNTTHLKGIEQNTIILLDRIWKYVLNRKVNFAILEKYECVLDLSHRSQFDRGTRPYQDVADLIKLRNALTHYVPETFRTGDASLDPKDQHKFEKLFAKRFNLNPFTSEGNPFYPDKILGHGCAEWATTSTIAFLDDFFSRLSLKAPYDHVRGALTTKHTRDA